MYTMSLYLVSLMKTYLPDLEREEGQGMIEYALIAALISIAAIAAVLLVGPKITTIFNNIVAAL